MADENKSVRDAEFSLSQAAARLSKGDLAGWNEFLRCLAERQFALTECFVSSPPERLAEMQGRARESRALYLCLHNAGRQADQSKQVKDRNNGPVAPKYSTNFPVI